MNGGRLFSMRMNGGESILLLAPSAKLNTIPLSLHPFHSEKEEEERGWRKFISPLLLFHRRRRREWELEKLCEAERSGAGWGFGCTWDGREGPGIPREKQKFCYSVAPPPPFLFRGLFEKTFTFTETPLQLYLSDFKLLTKRNKPAGGAFSLSVGKFPAWSPYKTFHQPKAPPPPPLRELHKLFLLLQSSAAIVIFIPRRRSGRKVGDSVKK